MARYLGIDDSTGHFTNISIYRDQNVYPVLNQSNLFSGREIRKGVNAKREYVAPIAEQTGIKYITGAGHGFDNAFYGYDCTWKKQCPLTGGPFYKEEEVKNKIIHLISCFPARVLGPDMVDKGCMAFFGYCEEFWINDYCCIPDSEIDIAFSEGEEARTVFTRTNDVYELVIAALYENCYPNLAAEIEDNMEGLRCPSNDNNLGFLDAKITP
ncbi:MAG: hypothetical protein ACW98D_08325 [Promethearchaeota archaeon]